MNQAITYTAKLGAGLGIIPETNRLLEIWSPGMSAADLLLSALNSGAFSSVSARRLKNLVNEAFAPRYLVQGGGPAKLLKSVLGKMSTNEFSHLLLIHTCRANPVLYDFIREVYWDRYAAGSGMVTKTAAYDFVRRAVADERTKTRWSESVILRVSQYVLGACADFGLLGSMRGAGRPILPFRATTTVIIYLAHELHFSGVGDSAIVHHPDWTIFGLTPNDVLDELKRLSIKGVFILQSAGGVTQIAWQLRSLEELADVLAAGRFQ